MKIVFVITSLEGFGGTNRVATLLANGLVQSYETIILSKFCLENTYQLDSRVKDIKFKDNDFKFILQCKQYIIENAPDKVIIHTMSKLTPAFIMAGVKSKEIWSMEHISFDFHSVLYKTFRKYFYKRIDKIITLTGNDAINYRSFHKDVNVIANANPLQILKKKADNQSKIVVSIGRLTYQKGYDLLISAWLLIEQEYPDWSLHIYGEGENRKKLEQLIKNKNLNRVVLKGLTDDVQSVYDNADIYVMSSRFEGFGMVLIEAQSRGLPIVSFNCPSGPAEIIQNDINGYLVKSGDIRALAEKISYLISNKSTRDRFSDKALISAQSFQLERIISQWLDTIDNKDDRNK